MRRLLPLVLAAIAAAAVPASASYVYSNACETGDYRAVDVVVADRGIVRYCLRNDPLTPDFVCSIVESICNPA